MRKICECNGSITVMITEVLILAIIHLHMFNLTEQDYTVRFILCYFLNNMFSRLTIIGNYCVYSNNHVSLKHTSLQVRVEEKGVLSVIFLGAPAPPFL